MHIYQVRPRNDHRGVKSELLAINRWNFGQRLLAESLQSVVGLFQTQLSDAKNEREYARAA